LAAPGGSRRILAWDAPVRLFHWLLAGLVVLSYATGKVGGEWLEWHMRSGYAILALLLFRIAWGFAGSQTARFAHFVRGPAAALAYVRTIAARGRERVAGHNPLGGWAVLAMLAALLVQATSGLFVDDEIATRGPLVVKASEATVSRMSALHSSNEWLVVGLVALHVAAIATYRFALGIDLVRPMWNGHLETAAPVAPPAVRPAWLAAVLMALAAAFVYWLVVLFPRSPA
jgi:cytochrome b